MKPLAPERYGLQVTLDEHAHDLLREAQDLLAHTEGGRQIAYVLTRALEVLVKQLRQRRFAETERPRRQDGKPKSSRRVPATVKRAVRARDQGRCTFVNANGERCPATGGLEYDHVKPVATGGETTVENVRLRCRAHNRLAAEQAYGEAFMREKCEASRRRAVSARATAGRKATKWRAAAEAEVVVREQGTSGSSAATACERRDDAMARQAIHEKAYEVIPWLRQRSMPAAGVP